MWLLGWSIVAAVAEIMSDGVSTCSISLNRGGADDLLIDVELSSRSIASILVREADGPLSVVYASARYCRALSLSLFRRGVGEGEGDLKTNPAEASRLS